MWRPSYRTRRTPLSWRLKGWLKTSNNPPKWHATLQMKVGWKSSINVWFRFTYSQKWNCPASLFPKQNCKVLSPNFHIYLSVSDLFFPGIGLPILLQPNRQTSPGNTVYKSLTDTWM
jgi:hypothetical protein